MKTTVALDFQQESVPYLRNLALVMLGRTDEALASVAVLDVGAAGRLGIFVESLRFMLEGRRDEVVAAVRRLTDIPDPEGRFYNARARCRFLASPPKRWRC